jgi:hypothetical protein
MKLGSSPEMLRTKRVVKRICIFAFEMASNITTTLPQRRRKAVAGKASGDLTEPDERPRAQGVSHRVIFTPISPLFVCATRSARIAAAHKRGLEANRPQGRYVRYGSLADILSARRHVR